MIFQQFVASLRQVIKPKIDALEARILKGECGDFASYKAAVKEREGMLDVLKLASEAAKKSDNT